MDDLISRQAAIDEMNGLPKWIDSDHGVCLDYSDVICVLGDTEKLPSAEPETTRRIVGKSKGGMTLWYECERCGEPVDEGDKFCRGCGAKMEVTE